MITAMVASSLLKLPSPGTAMFKSAGAGPPERQAAGVHSQRQTAIACLVGAFILSLPVPSGGALLAPESDLDVDEPPAASSRRDA